MAEHKSLYIWSLEEAVRLDERDQWRESHRENCDCAKTAEDGLEEGVRFRLTGTSDSGAKIDVTVTVDSTGKAYFKDILVGSGYVLEEVDTAIQYIVPASQTTPIEWNKVTQKDFYNKLKRGSLKVIKTSEDMSTSLIQKW